MLNNCCNKFLRQTGSPIFCTGPVSYDGWMVGTMVITTGDEDISIFEVVLWGTSNNTKETNHDKPLEKSYSSLDFCSGSSKHRLLRKMTRLFCNRGIRSCWDQGQWCVGVKMRVHSKVSSPQRDKELAGWITARFRATGRPYCQSKLQGFCQKPLNTNRPPWGSNPRPQG